jgi:hypothetical protein
MKIEKLIVLIITIFGKVQMGLSRLIPEFRESRTTAGVLNDE